MTARSALRVAQVHHERVELAEGRPPEVADVAQRRLRVAHLPGLGLHHHRGDVVADHVVQLAGQAGALLEPGGLAAQLLRLARAARACAAAARSRSPSPPPKATPMNARGRAACLDAEDERDDDPSNPPAQPTHGTERRSSATDTEDERRRRRATADTVSPLVQAATNAAPTARTVERHRWLGSDASTVTGIA